MVLVEELKEKFSVEKIEPYGEVIVVPSRQFQTEWEASLEAEGHRVLSNSYNGELAFFIRLSKGKPRSGSSIDYKPKLASRSITGFPNYHGNLLKIIKNPRGENREMVVVEQLKREFKEIPIELISCSSSPSRETFEDIDCLAETIKRHGLLEPILVRKLKDKYGFQVVVGERRLRACRKAGLERVPCIVVDGVSEEQILQMQIVENVQRTDLKVFEEIKIVETLKDNFHLNDEEIAVKTGLSHGTVQNYLTIAKGLPREYIKIISHGSHTPTDLTVMKALILARANLPADQLKEIVELIQRTGISTQNLAKKLAQRPSISKIKRVRESRVYWQELTKTIRAFARYWSNYCQMREWEDVESYHLELQVSLPKDLKESEEN